MSSCIFYIQSISYILVSVSQKWTPYLFQNDAALHFQIYWKQENVADINFLVLHWLNSLSFPMKKQRNFAADHVKSYDFNK